MYIWAVYDRTDGLEPVVWPLYHSIAGDWVPVEHSDMPPICELPIKVYRRRANAYRAVARLMYDCAGCA